MNNQPGPIEHLAAFAIVAVVTVSMVRLYDWTVRRKIIKVVEKK